MKTQRGFSLEEKTSKMGKKRPGEAESKRDGEVLGFSLRFA